MKLKNVLFTAVLIMAICASCAPAGQTAAESSAEQGADLPQ